jgi:hypothetical protein
MPTVRAIVGNKMAAGLLDRFLARIGYSAQQTNEPEDTDRPDNLWAPVPGDHGAHGRFDAIAHDTSAQLWFLQHRSVILTALVLFTMPTAWAMWLGLRGHGSPRTPRPTMRIS